MTGNIDVASVLLAMPAATVSAPAAVSTDPSGNAAFSELLQSISAANLVTVSNAVPVVTKADVSAAKNSTGASLDNKRVTDPGVCIDQLQVLLQCQTTTIAMNSVPVSTDSSAVPTSNQNVNITDANGDGEKTHSAKSPDTASTSPSSQPVVLDPLVLVNPDSQVQAPPQLQSTETTPPKANVKAEKIPAHHNRHLPHLKADQSFTLASIAPQLLAPPSRPTTETPGKPESSSQVSNGTATTTQSDRDQAVVPKAPSEKSEAAAIVTGQSSVAGVPQLIPTDASATSKIADSEPVQSATPDVIAHVARKDASVAGATLSTSKQEYGAPIVWLPANSELKTSARPAAPTESTRPLSDPAAPSQSIAELKVKVEQTRLPEGIHIDLSKPPQSNVEWNVVVAPTPLPVVTGIPLEKPSEAITSTPRIASEKTDTTTVQAADVDIVNAAVGPNNLPVAVSLPEYQNATAPVLSTHPAQSPDNNAIPQSEQSISENASPLESASATRILEQTSQFIQVADDQKSDGDRRSSNVAARHDLPLIVHEKSAPENLASSFLPAAPSKFSVEPERESTPATMLAGKILEALPKPLQATTIVIRPEGFGTIQIRISPESAHSDAAWRITIRTSDPAAHALLSQSVNEIRQNLRSEAVNIVGAHSTLEQPAPAARASQEGTLSRDSGQERRQQFEQKQSKNRARGEVFEIPETDE